MRDIRGGRHIGSTVGVAALLWIPDAQATGRDPRLPLELRSEPTRPQQRHVTPMFASLLTASDRFDLARFKAHAAIVEIGSVALQFGANRTIGPIRARDGLFPSDKWSARSMGMEASVGVGEKATLAIGGSMTRMSRRLGIIPIDSGRLSTAIMTGGAALRTETQRIALDYVHITRSARTTDLSRVAETLGGAPLTGRGVQLSLASQDGPVPGTLNWRFALASMQRPSRDLWLDGSRAVPRNFTDTRATMTIGLPF